MARKPRTKKISEAVFPVWLAKKMLFNQPDKRRVIEYRMYTECLKVKYTPAILKYLDKMEKIAGDIKAEDTAIAISLNGMVRYVWRSDVFVKSEFDKQVKNDQKKISKKILCKNG